MDNFLEYTQFTFLVATLVHVCCNGFQDNDVDLPVFAHTAMDSKGGFAIGRTICTARALNLAAKKFCIYREFSLIVFLRKLHKRTEEIRTGQ